MPEWKAKFLLLKAKVAAFRRLALALVNHPKYKFCQSLVFGACLIWAAVIVAGGIPYYVYIGQGKSAFLQGRYGQAEELFLFALKEAEHFDASDPRLANALNNLGELYRIQARYEKAEPIYERLEKIAQNNLSNKRQEAAVLFNNSAAFFRDKGDYARAEAVYKQALSVWENEVKKSKDPNYAGLLSGLARVYKDEGRYADAEPLLLKALSLKEQSRGPDHPEVAAVLSSLGGLFRKEANYARSESCYRRALSIDIRNYGWQHPDTALDENSLAGLLRDMGRYAEAEPLNIRSLNTRKLLLGLSHPETARSLLGLGQLRLAQGRELEALALIKQALSVDRQVYASENHPDCADCLNALSVLYRHDNKFDLALQAIRRCLNIRLARLAADHPDLAEAYFNQGEIFLLQHDYTQAEPLFLQAKLIQEKVLGNRHPALALTLQALAAVQARKNGCK